MKPGAAAASALGWVTLDIRAAAQRRAATVTRAWMARGS